MWEMINSNDEGRKIYRNQKAKLKMKANEPAQL